MPEEEKEEKKEEKEEEWRADKTQQQIHWSHPNTKFRSAAAQCRHGGQKQSVQMGNLALSAKTSLILPTMFSVSIKRSPG